MDEKWLEPVEIRRGKEGEKDLPRLLLFTVNPRGSLAPQVRIHYGNYLLLLLLLLLFVFVIFLYACKIGGGLTDDSTRMEEGEGGRISRDIRYRKKKGKKKSREKEEGGRWKSGVCVCVCVWLHRPLCAISTCQSSGDAISGRDLS
jgi:hypothetical protein